MRIDGMIELARRFPQDAEIVWNGREISVYTRKRYNGRIDWPLDSEELPDWSKPDGVVEGEREPRIVRNYVTEEYGQVLGEVNGHPGEWRVLPFGYDSSLYWTKEFCNEVTDQAEKDSALKELERIEAERVE